jgi:hypothetical protein
VAGMRVMPPPSCDLNRSLVPIASFLHDVEFDRYRGIADMAGLAGDPPPSRMTPNRQTAPGHE